MDYDQLPRSALIRLLQEHDAALLDAGRDGIVMSYTAHGPVADHTPGQTQT